MLAILAESAFRSLLLGSAVWAGLHVFRVRNPHVQMTSWAIVLAASLAMPMLMHWTTVTVILAAPIVDAPTALWSAAAALPDLPPSSPPPTAVIADAASHITRTAINWPLLVTAIYAIVAGFLLLRLALGLYLTWRLSRTALPLHAPWVGDADIRVSPRVGGPMTFGTIILLPPDYGDWDEPKRRAVLAHEGAHVANRDSFLLMMAALNCAVFWFSPFAWWQAARLAELAELISDAKALEVVDDRLSYAQVLVELMQRVQQTPVGLHMARACTVRARVERILSGPAVVATAGWRMRTATVAAIAPVVIVSGLAIGWSTPSRSMRMPDMALETARRLAEAPDRFRGQAPQPGSKEAVLRGIAELQSGHPDYSRMTAPLAAKIRRESARLMPMLQTLGAVESIFFRGVGPGGYDIYGLKFAGGSAEIRVHLTAEGEVDDALFRPDGDATLGQILACSGEAALKSHGGTAPVSVYFYNDTGHDIQLHEIDGEGRRVARETVGDDMSSTVWTTVDRPWVVTDASGQCLEIVFPGLRTRFNTVQGAQTLVHWNAPRTTPMAGSEELLRHYIEAVGRGQPDYDQMTTQVAAFTRAQQPLNQAILGRLGALQAISFRGVSGSGNDIYMAHFSNGTAEWRIGLNKDRRVARIALGPQY